MPTFAELKNFLISETQAQVFVTGVVLCIAIPLIVTFIRYFQLPKQHKSTVEFSKHLIIGGVVSVVGIIILSVVIALSITLSKSFEPFS